MNTDTQECRAATTFRAAQTTWMPGFRSSCSRFDGATYAEGYAGPGIHTKREPGSPIRAVRRPANARHAHPRVGDKPARFVLVEKRQDRVEELLAQPRIELDDPMPAGEYRDNTLHVQAR
jgi:hypothetical protein